MERSQAYIGFPSLPDKAEIIEALVKDPPEIRWRRVRDLFHIKDRQDRETLIEALRPYALQTEDWKLKFRITLALQALHHPLKEGEYVLVKGKGAFKSSELENTEKPIPQEMSLPAFFPIVDSHIHPKSPDLKFFSDLREAGVTHAVILATDTDPEDVDRPEIKDKLQKDYAKSTQSSRMPFDRVLKHIKASLYSATHVTNQDVADWVRDYPAQLIGFGSVNPSKERTYVEKTLEELKMLSLRGIKFLPHSQFFNPAENPNMDLICDFCRQTGTVILSHSGCGPGPFEILELSHNSHPQNWAPLLQKYQDVPVVLAHFGAYSTEIPGIWLYETMQLGKKYKNVYVDLAAVDWLLSREMVVQEIRKTIGFDRVLFATDYPLPLASGVSLAYIVSSVKANIYMTDKEKRKVLGGNAARLLGLS